MNWQLRKTEAWLRYMHRIDERCAKARKALRRHDALRLR
jgi:hypothetical protein